jgi:hypothetical protein
VEGGILVDALVDEVGMTVVQAVRLRMRQTRDKDESIFFMLHFQLAGCQSIITLFELNS